MGDEVGEAGSWEERKHKEGDLGDLEQLGLNRRLKLELKGGRL